MEEYHNQHHAGNAHGDPAQKGIDGVERALQARLEGQEDPTVSLHCDKTVAIDEVVKVMNVAKDNNYKLILATQP